MSSLAINGFTLTHAALNATPGVTPIERLILATLGSFANFLSECWPSNRTLAEKTGLHERTVSKAIGKLQEKGLIERKSRGQGRAMLTRILIPLTPPAQSLPPPAHGLPEPARNLLQIPIAVHEPTTIEPSTETAIAAVPVVSVIEQPEQPFPAIPELAQEVNNQASQKSGEIFASDCNATPPIPAIEQPANTTTEAPKTPVAPSNEADPAIPTLDTNQATQDPVIEADPVEEAVKALASLPKALLDDMAMIRTSKKRPAKITRTEAQILTDEARKAGWTLEQVIVTMICHGWARFSASWVVPAQAQPSASPQAWKPEIVKEASPDVVAAMKAKIAKMKERWAAEKLAQTAPPMRQ